MPDRMTWREALGDWLSGGALTRARGEADDMAKNARGWKVSCLHYEGALDAIIACETPSANDTVRRMARIAREALE